MEPPLTDISGNGHECYIAYEIHEFGPFIIGSDGCSYAGAGQTARSVSLLLASQTLTLTPFNVRRTIVGGGEESPLHFRVPHEGHPKGGPRAYRPLSIR